MSLRPLLKSSLSRQSSWYRWACSSQHYGNAMLSTTTTNSGFDKVGVIGLGLMGHGICQVAAVSGIHSKGIVAYEPQQKFLDVGKARIEQSLAKLVNKGKISQNVADKTLSTITFTTDMNELSDTDMVVEAVIENMDLKKDIYTNLGKICEPKTIFASNTSGLSITEMAQFSGRTEKFLGVHFFNPVQLMKLVEVIRTKETDHVVFQKCYSWVSEIGKVPVSCGDTPGFIVNRLLVPSFIQSMLMVDRGDATVEDIDVSMQLGAGHPMGPLHLADYIGLDTILSVMKSWKEGFPDEPSFVVPKCIQDKVSAGHFGRKAGKGFYHWEGDKRGNPA